MPDPLYPMGPDGGVTCTAGVRGGTPCLRGTGVPTYILAERWDAGDDLAVLADDYGAPNGWVLDCIDYERLPANVRRSWAMRGVWLTRRANAH